MVKTCFLEGQEKTGICYEYSGPSAPALLDGPPSREHRTHLVNEVAQEIPVEVREEFEV